MRFVPVLAVVVDGPCPLRVARRARSDPDARWPGAGGAAARRGRRSVGFSRRRARAALARSPRGAARNAPRPCDPGSGRCCCRCSGLLLLLLPYLPLLPDALPALQMLAGPARGVVWLAVATQFVWVLWQVRLVRADWLQRATLRRGWPSRSASRRCVAHGRRGRAADRHGAVSRRRRTALPGHRAEPLARRRSQDREQPRARRLPRVLPARSRAALPDARRRRRDLLDSSRRHAGADGAGLRGRRLPRASCSRSC